MHIAADSGFNFTVKRNCSISPQALCFLLGALALLVLGIAVGFAWYGAWMIIPFAGVEVLALAAAFYLNGRHAGDYERLTLQSGSLVLEQHEVMSVARRQFNPAWVRVVEQGPGIDYRVTLRANGEEIEIGRHLDADRRRALAQRIRCGLSRYQIA